ncbi:DUF3618 domain-containing protein [Leucobacter sp. Z1108]|uniref:DUF3618 domain-containing protein n=1 Tax=Leucobacter sp. Z1108 TaxID=3439066 RepID=UPI003F2F12D8
MSDAPQVSSGVQKAQLARAELYDTLGQLRGRLDYAQRIDDTIARTKQRVADVGNENPLAFAAGVAGAAVAAGLTVWGVARLVMRAFD